MRSDKKKDVKPTIRIELKDAIYRLAFITKTPVKDVCESMINFAVSDSSIINILAPYFIRDIRMNNSILKGHLDNPRYEKFESGNCERITLRLTQGSHNNVTILAYATDLNPSRVCAILLNTCMHDFRFLNYYTSQYLQNELSYNQMVELKEMLRYITKNVNVEASMASLLSMIVNEVTPPTREIKDAVNDFILHNWREKK